ncbi:DUF4411 family protein [Neisseria musculi]|uniref:DUF4411 family protein n=1 Tax=Neisseria musculi TaxID=1815583 RepID=A0A7H1MCJ3_9NEIS|nr:DUF4411 family protein [Neisseria musculi]QNT59358.1 hypothetical protein H7A79_2483 [Neisseria musculi]
MLNQHVVLPKIVVDEVNKSDEFKEWLEQNFNGEYLNHKDYAEEWGQVIQHIAQHSCYSDKALIDPRSWTHEKIADGWLIAIAKKDGLTIVTNELAKRDLNAQNPSKEVKNPDIAKDFGIKCITMNEFFQEIGFKL